MSTSDPGGLGAAIMATSDFVALVRDNTIIDRVPNFRRVPLNVAVPAVTADANAHQVGEGVTKPLSKFSTELLTVTPRKIAAAVVVTRELLRFSSGLADSMLAMELARAVGAVADRRFLDPDAAGSITNGATVINSGGGSLVQLDADFKAMLKALAASGDEALTNAVWIMPSAVAIYLAGVRGTGGALAYPLVTAKGGSLMGVPVFTTGALNATGSPAEYALTLLDPQQILLGDEGNIAITVAEHATVQLDDAPDSPPTASTVTMSLWQANRAAPRAERWVGWQRVSTASVVTMDNIQWA
jgi:HK97 family phage major capsid protein